MKQINNGFQKYYYLTKDGKVFNSYSKRIIKQDKKHLFCLITLDNKTKHIALKTLYRLVYNQNYCIDRVVSMEQEMWKVIDDTKDLYYVSNKGRVKSLQGYNAIILKPRINQSGYDRVELAYVDKRRNVLVHRLVAQAFLPAPERLDMQLHHKDFNKRNNDADNLVWLTPAAHSRIHRERDDANDRQ